MKTTINLDDDLFREVALVTGIKDKTAMVHEGLRLLLARESARRLAMLGGSMPRAKAPPRRRPTVDAGKRGGR